MLLILCACLSVNVWESASDPRKMSKIIFFFFFKNWLRVWLSAQEIILVHFGAEQIVVEYKSILKRSWKHFFVSLALQEERENT